MCDRTNQEDARTPRSTQSMTSGNAREMTPEEKVNVMFAYHQPNELQQTQYVAIRDAARHLAHVILHNTPRSADQTASLRKLSEAVMTANAAIARQGVSV